MALIKTDPVWWLPTAWPLGFRRAFFVTLPMSGPLWLVLVIAGYILAGILILVVAVPVVTFFELKEKLWDAHLPQVNADTK